MKFGLVHLSEMGALRRFVAALCAIAFLTVGFAHLTHHSDFVSNGVAVEMSVATDASGSVGDPDLAKKPSVLEHCHGCLMIAIQTAELPQFHQVTADVPTSEFQQLQALLRLVDNPPPRA